MSRPARWAITGLNGGGRSELANRSTGKLGSCAAAIPLHRWGLDPPKHLARPVAVARAKDTQHSLVCCSFRRARFVTCSLARRNGLQEDKWCCTPSPTSRTQQEILNSGGVRALVTAAILAR